MQVESCLSGVLVTWTGSKTYKEKTYKQAQGVVKRPDGFLLVYPLGGDDAMMEKIVPGKVYDMSIMSRATDGNIYINVTSVSEHIGDISFIGATTKKGSVI